MSDKISTMPVRKKRGRPRPNHFFVMLDEEDRIALEEAAKLEKLTKSDVLRRALRAYYRELRKTQAIAS